MSIRKVTKDIDKDTNLLDVIEKTSENFMISFNELRDEGKMNEFIKDRNKLFAEGINCFNHMWRFECEDSREE